ncbi:unnamed protein product [Amoebophrya sp. A120]|nr:unnamed protein product [Amoebophrya sp. A120]|eukprot:GSA120T00003898001.1
MPSLDDPEPGSLEPGVPDDTGAALMDSGANEEEVPEGGGESEQLVATDQSGGIQPAFPAAATKQSLHGVPREQHLEVANKVLNPLDPSIEDRHQNLKRKISDLISFREERAKSAYSYEQFRASMEEHKNSVDITQLRREMEGIKNGYHPPTLDEDGRISPSKADHEHLEAKMQQKFEYLRQKMNTNSNVQFQQLEDLKGKLDDTFSESRLSRLIEQLIDMHLHKAFCLLFEEFQQSVQMRGRSTFTGSGSSSLDGNYNRPSGIMKRMTKHDELVKKNYNLPDGLPGWFFQRKYRNAQKRAEEPAVGKKFSDGLPGWFFQRRYRNAKNAEDPDQQEAGRAAGIMINEDDSVSKLEATEGADDQHAYDPEGTVIELEGTVLPNEHVNNAASKYTTMENYHTPSQQEPGANIKTSTPAPPPATKHEWKQGLQAMIRSSVENYLANSQEAGVMMKEEIARIVTDAVEARLDELLNAGGGGDQSRKNSSRVANVAGGEDALANSDADGDGGTQEEPNTGDGEVENGNGAEDAGDRENQAENKNSTIGGETSKPQTVAERLSYPTNELQNLQTQMKTQYDDGTMVATMEDIDVTLTRKVMVLGEEVVKLQQHQLSQQKILVAQEKTILKLLELLEEREINGGDAAASSASASTDLLKKFDYKAVLKSVAKLEEDKEGQFNILAVKQEQMDDRLTHLEEELLAGGAVVSSGPAGGGQDADGAAAEK